MMNWSLRRIELSHRAEAIRVLQAQKGQHAAGHPAVPQEMMEETQKLSRQGHFSCWISEMKNIGEFLSRTGGTLNVKVKTN